MQFQPVFTSASPPSASVIPGQMIATMDGTLWIDTESGRVSFSGLVQCATTAERDVIPSNLRSKGKLYCVEQVGSRTNVLYRWSGSAFVEVSTCDCAAKIAQLEERIAILEGYHTGTQPPPSLTPLEGYIFPTGYPTAQSINTWTTEGLRFYGNNGTLLGTVTSALAAPASIKSTAASYYEFEQDVQFDVIAGYENTAHIKWRVPRENKPYWQYNGSTSLSTHSIDCVHIMSSLYPNIAGSNFVRRARFMDGSNNPVTVSVSVYYYAAGKTYRLTVGSQTFDFTPDSLSEGSADEVGFTV